MRWLAALIVLVAPASRADEGEPDRPVARVVSVRGSLASASARFVARYTVQVPGPAMSYDVELPIPAGAVATRATVIADGAAHELALMPAERARDELHAVETGPVGPRPRWAAEIRELGTVDVALTVAAPHAATIAIDLELAAPSCFHRDARFVLAPAAWREATPRALRAPREPEPCTAAFDGGVWLQLAAPELARRPPGEARVSAFAGRLALDDEHFARVELDIAGRLGEVPRDLATAIVVDGSRSLTPAEIDVQRELVAAYLRAVPETRVQLIAYARGARALLPSWTTASLAATRVDRELRALAPRNGSNADAGLAEAARWLARVEGTRRIVVISDDRLAHRFATLPATALQRLLPPHTLVHVAAVTPGDTEPTREDWPVLGALARATEGLAIATGLPKAGLDVTLLARPITLDAIEVKAPGWRALPIDGRCTDMLAEGNSCTWWGHGGALAGPIAIDALVWGKRITRVVQPDAARATHVARELATFRLLDDPAQRQAEAAARAVNRSWALFASWGGSHGYGEVVGTIGGMSSSGNRGGSHDLGTGSIGTRAPLPPLELGPQLASGVARCGLGGRAVTADIETTLSEIVDVAVAVAPYDRTIAVCVEDAIWDTAVQVPARYPTAVSHVVF